MKIALTHRVSPNINECELTHSKKEPISYELARKQHETYCQILQSQGIKVRELTINLSHQDSCFIEDTAVVLDEVAIMASMGVKSRIGEVSGIENELTKFRVIKKIKPPGFLEGGDVLVIGKHVFIGLTTRTNKEGIKQFEQIASPFGYQIIPIEVNGCLHLKSACTALNEINILVNTNWISAKSFSGYNIVQVSPDEPMAANCLNLNGKIFIASGFPETRKILELRGYSFNTINISELQKAEGALTCSSIIFEDKKG